MSHTGTTPKKKILLVEDDAIIAMAEEDTLCRYGFDVITVHSGEKAIAAAETDRSIDLILMDIDLGKGMDGTEAAETILKTHNTPVVFLSNHTEPDVVNKTERITSYGYVVKNSGETVLVASIKMAFRLYEANCTIQDQASRITATNEELVSTNEELSATNEEFEAQNKELLLSQDELLRNESVMREQQQYLIMSQRIAGYGCFVSFTDDRPVWLSDEAKKILGIPSGLEIDPNILIKMVHPDGTDEVNRVRGALRNDETSIISEARIKRMSDGEVRSILCTMEISNDSDSIIQRIVGTFIDITDKKNAEREMNLRGLAIENSFNGFFIIKDNLLHYANRSFLRMFGYASCDEIPSRNPKAICPDSAAFESIINSTCKAGSGLFDFQGKRKDGSLFDAYLSTQAYRDDEKSDYLMGSLIDITGHKHSQQTLIETIQYQRRIMDNAPFGAHFYRLDSGNRLIFDGANPAAEKMLHIDHDALTGKTIEEAFPGIGTDIPARYKETALTGAPFSRNEVIYNNGAISGAYEIHAFRTGPRRMAVFFNDITRRLKSEDELRESETNFRSTFELAAVGIAHLLPSGRFLRVNNKLCGMLGYSREELLSFDYTQITHPDDLALNKKYVQHLIDGKSDSYLYEKRFIRKDGTPVWVYVTVSTLRDENNKLRHFIAVIEDITERKAMIKRLHDIEERYNLVINNIDDVIWIYDIALQQFTYVSPSVEKMRGYTAEEVSHQSLEEIFPRESINDIQATLAVMIEGNLKGNPDTRVQRSKIDQYHKNGSIITTEIVATLITNDEGSANRVLGVTRDITNRLAQETELRKRQLLLERAQYIALIGYWEIDLETQKAWGSPVAHQIYGIAPGEMPISELQQSSLPEYSEKLELQMKNLIEKGEPYDIEFRIKRNTDGTIATIHSMAEYDPELNKVFGVIQDISESKLIENQLRQSEERYIRITDSLLDYIYSVRVRHGKAIGSSHSPGCTTVTGYTVQDFMNDPNLWLGMVHSDDRRLVEEQSRLILAGHDVPPFEHRIYRKDGTLRWVCNTPVLHRDTEGNLVSYDGLIQDITDRKVAEKALVESEKKFRTLVENIHDVLWQMSTDFIFTYISPNVLKLIDYSPDDVIGKTLWDILPSDTAELISVESEKRKEAAYRNEPIGNAIFTFKLETKTKSTVWIEIISTPMYNDTMNLTGFQGIMRDITSQKQSEQELRLSEKLLNESQRVAHLGHYIYDVHTGIWTSSPTLDEIFGIRPGFIKDRQGICGIIPSDDIIEIEQYMRDHVIRDNKPFDRVLRIIRADTGDIRWVHSIGKASFDDSGMITEIFGTIQDVTDRKQIEEILEKTLSEKEALLHELNHRVKNSLATISGLVGLELTRSKDYNFTTSLENLRGRINTIANLYTMLSTNSEADKKEIFLNIYLERIASSLAETYITESKQIIIEQSYDRIMMDVKRAATMGLILNELLTNVFKYAFPDGKGTIEIILANSDSGIILSISDNGIGLPKNFDPNVSHGLGMKLVTMLAKQTNFRLDISRTDKTTFTLTIPR
jgi:PAS domain S-box-containing protein